MSNQEVKTRQTFEEWWKSDWKSIVQTDEGIAQSAWRAALANVEPGGDWAVELSNMVPWDKVKSTNVVICAYDQTGDQVANFGKINRPLPKTVELTDDEKLMALEREIHRRNEQIGVELVDTVRDLARALATGKTLDELCQQYGIEITRRA